MQPPEVTSEQDRKERLFDLAFRRWWEADYSVEGLRKKLIPSGTGSSTTLYDYWFNWGNPPAVVKFADREWTVFHLPMHDLDGQPSEKGRWSVEQISAFYGAIFDREQSGEHRYNHSSVSDEAARARAVFDGVVFPASREVCTHNAVSPSYRDAVFVGDAELGGHGTTNSTDFSRTLFLKRAVFDRRNFQGNTRFDSAVFLDRAYFADCGFAREVSFTKATFQSWAYFRNAGFGGTVDFRDVKIFDAADFTGSSAQVVNFDLASFLGDAFFSGREFHGLVSFEKTKFVRSASFRDCRFLGPVKGSPEFHDTVDFSCKSGGDFGGEVDFHDAKFMSSVDFSGREFRRATRFIACAFGPAPDFFGAKPHPSTTFSGSSFAATVGGPESGSLPESRYAQWMFYWWPFAEWLPSLRLARHARNASTKKLEDSYRTLRHLFEDDGEQSGRFYALEMDTRRHRTDVSIVERWVLFLFWLSSGYGRYLGRSLLVLLASIGIVTVILWNVLGQLVYPDLPPAIGEVFAFVWRLFLLPVPLSSADAAKVYWVAAFIKKWPVIYVLLSGMCAFLTTGTVGVILVTLRRRFALK